MLIWLWVAVGATDMFHMFTNRMYNMGGLLLRRKVADVPISDLCTGFVVARDACDVNSSSTEEG